MKLKHGPQSQGTLSITVSSYLTSLFIIVVIVQSTIIYILYIYMCIYI